MKEHFLKGKEVLKRYDADAFFSPNKVNIRYFTGLDAEGFFLLTQDKIYLFLPPLYYMLEQNLGFIEKIIFKQKENMKQKIKEIGVERIAYDNGELSIALYENLKQDFEMIGVKDEIRKIRMIKDKEEIKKIKRAASIARNAFMNVFPYVKPGVREKEIADELSYQMRKCGADREAFPTIVASGVNTAIPHSIPSDKKIEDGDFVVIDFGAYVDGYNSDCTYTLLMGKKTDEKREIYNAVFHAQTHAIEAAYAGVKASDVDKEARNYLKKLNYDKYFIHSTGHGVGLQVHELPNISPQSDTIIEDNMVFTVEPGVYIPGKFGVRLEQMICINGKRVEMIAFAPFSEVM